MELRELREVDAVELADESAPSRRRRELAGRLRQALARSYPSEDFAHLSLNELVSFVIERVLVAGDNTLFSSREH